MNFIIHEIDDFIFYKIIENNIINEKYFDIHNIIIKKKMKLRDIIFVKCLIIDDVFYYKNRL